MKNQVKVMFALTRLGLLVTIVESVVENWGLASTVVTILCASFIWWLTAFLEGMEAWR